jgi:hypothetical protein
VQYLSRDITALRGGRTEAETGAGCTNLHLDIKNANLLLRRNLLDGCDTCAVKIPAELGMFDEAVFAD